MSFHPENVPYPFLQIRMLTAPRKTYRLGYWGKERSTEVFQRLRQITVVKTLISHRVRVEGEDGTPTSTAGTKALDLKLSEFPYLQTTSPLHIVHKTVYLRIVRARENLALINHSKEFSNSKTVPPDWKHQQQHQAPSPSSVLCTSQAQHRCCPPTPPPTSKDETGLPRQPFMPLPE